MLTNAEGEFALRDVPAGTQLVTVKLFGYKPSSRTVTVVNSGRVTVRFVLTPTATVLSGVVTTATGVQERREVGNDITVPNADSIMRGAPVQYESAYDKRKNSVAMILVNPMKHLILSDIIKNEWRLSPNNVAVEDEGRLSAYIARALTEVPR